MSSDPFKFKQFRIHQDRCAMKIGTDGVLLGAWSNVKKEPNSILDIGSGTGIIALMLAQRSSSELIDALEIDDDSFEQCVSNFENSIWSDRLFCYHASLMEFVKEIDDSYDLIVSNPPFYSENFNGKNIKRGLARFADAMPFDQLLSSVSKLLSETGIFSVIIPYKEEGKFISIASQSKLFPHRILRVKGTPTTDVIRSLIEFSFEKKEIEIDMLIIETARHQYTQDYIELTKDFYLNM